MLGNAFGNAHSERNLGLEGLLDTGGSKRGAIHKSSVSKVPKGERVGEGSLRNEDGGGRSAGLLDGLAHIGEDGEIKMCLASLLGVCAANDLGT